MYILPSLQVIEAVFLLEQPLHNLTVINKEFYTQEMNIDVAFFIKIFFMAFMKPAFLA